MRIITIFRKGRHRLLRINKETTKSQNFREAYITESTYGKEKISFFTDREKKSHVLAVLHYYTNPFDSVT